jgi:hypothetical protein
VAAYGKKYVRFVTEYLHGCSTRYNSQIFPKQNQAVKINVQFLGKHGEALALLGRAGYAASFPPSYTGIRG